MIDLSRLVGRLSNTKLQKEDIALYGVIRDLINGARTNESELQQSVANLTTIINNFTGNTYNIYQSLLAADGIDGNDGIGVAGPIGATGPAGADGTIGTVGTPGLDGNEGDEGFAIPGPVGPTGATGATGATGSTIPLMGLDGEPGEQGYAIPGPVGPTGAVAGAPKACLVYKAAVQVVSSGSTTVLTFDSEYWDNDSMHESATNPTRVTFTTAGKYTVKGMFLFGSSNAGYRYVDVRLNGTTLLAYDIRGAVTTDSSGGNICFDYEFAAGDYVEIRAFQSSGGNLNVTARFGATQIPGI